MSELRISQSDIDALAAALDELDLTEEQRTLLSAIVDAAAGLVTIDAGEPLGALPAEPSSLDGVPAGPSLGGAPAGSAFSQQFATAFTPGTATQLVALAHIGRG